MTTIKRLNINTQERQISQGSSFNSDIFNDTISEIANDFTNVSTQWNESLVPLFKALPNGILDSATDAFVNGLDGKTVYADYLADSTIQYIKYFHSSKGRPKTVKEVLDDIYALIENLGVQVGSNVIVTGSGLTELQRQRIGINIFDNSQVSQSTSLDGLTARHSLDIEQVARDLYGTDYALNNNGVPILNNNVKTMVDALLEAHEGNWTNDVALSHDNVPSILALRQFVGSPSPSSTSPNYSNNNYVVDGDNLLTAISTLDASLSVINSNYAVAATYNAARAMDGTNKKYVLVLGRTALQDGGEGIFIWDPVSTTADNDGTILTGSIGTGRWKRIFQNGVSTSWFGAKADTGITDNVIPFTNAFNVANNLGVPVLISSPGAGNEYHFLSNVGLPTLTNCPGIVTVDGDRTAILKWTLTANRDGDCIKTIGANKFLKNIQVANMRTTALTTRSAAIRITNCAYGYFEHISAFIGADNNSGIMLEHAYTGSVDDAYLLVHIGAWYNTFIGVQITYLSVGGDKGYGVDFYLNPNAIGVVNPTGQPPGTYNGSVAFNTIINPNIEGMERGINLDYAGSNTIIGGQFIGCTHQIYARFSAGNSIINTKHNQWNYVSGSAYNFDSTCQANAWTNPVFFNTNAQPWQLGIDSSIINTLGAAPTWVCGADGITWNAPFFRGGALRSVTGQLALDLNGTTNNIMRPDAAGVGLALYNGRFATFGRADYYDAIGNLTALRRDVGSNTTTTNTPTDIGSCSLGDNQAVLITFSVTARRTGGSRGTGAVNDCASWEVKCLAVKNGTGATAATIIESPIITSLFMSSDLATAGLIVQVGTGATGLVKITGTGATNVNLNWTCTYEMKAIS